MAIPYVPQDPGLYYSGAFQYNHVWYGNSYYTGVVFPESVLTQYKVEVMTGKVEGTIHGGMITAMSLPTSGLVGRWDLNGNVNDTSGNNNNGTAYNASWVSA